MQRLISPALPHMFALWPRCTKRWIDRIYREVGSARVRFIMMIMIIMTKIVPIIYMIYRAPGCNDNSGKKGDDNAIGDNYNGAWTKYIRRLGLQGMIITKRLKGLRNLLISSNTL